MARKLKTYQTSVGFYDMAVAAPTMKAALQAWGSDRNLFHDGLARETDDAAIVAATMAKPGIVLRRPVGSTGAFAEQASVAKALPAARPRAPARPARARNDVAERRAAHAFEREQAHRERQRRKEEERLARERTRKEAAIAAAESALAKASARHAASQRKFDRARAALDVEAAAEEQRWTSEKELLDAKLRAARR